MARIPLIGSSILAVLLGLTLIGCGPGQDSGSSQTADPSGLSAEQLKNGIGPVKSITLGAVDEGLAEKGDAIFQTKCSACHKLDTRYVGPALGDVLERRTPEFVMNMMLNPAEMVERHPEVKALLAQFLTPMPNQNLTEDDARAVLEYFRREAEGQDDSEQS